MTATLSKSNEISDELTQVPLSSLAKLTGFPADFIKKELLLKDPTSMEALRSSMAKYLDRTLSQEPQ